MRLFQCSQQDISGNAMDFDIHLNGIDALCRTCDLEVHIAQSIFHALNIGKDGEFAAIFDETHRDACDRCLDRYTCIHEGHGAAADRSLRGRTIGFQDLRNDADCIREFIDTRDDREERTFCERTMTDLTASRTTGAFVSPTQ